MVKGDDDMNATLRDKCMSKMLVVGMHLLPMLEAEMGSV